MTTVSKLIIPDYPNPKGSRNNQFAPFRDGVNELIFKVQFLKEVIYRIN